jgi:hypothetical protein
MILILREKEVVNQEQKRYTKTQELYEKQKAMEVKTVESN